MLPCQRRDRHADVEVHSLRLGTLGLLLLVRLPQSWRLVLSPELCSAVRLRVPRVGFAVALQACRLDPQDHPLPGHQMVGGTPRGDQAAADGTAP